MGKGYGYPTKKETRNKGKGMTLTTSDSADTGQTSRSPPLQEALRKHPQYCCYSQETDCQDNEYQEFVVNTDRQGTRLCDVDIIHTQKTL